MKIFSINLLRLRQGVCFAAAAVIIAASSVLTENFSAVPEPIRQGGDNKEIALCCNVFWGEEYLPEMLKILDEENVRLTFFIGGTWAEENPAMLKDIAARGHELGNHSFNHPHVNNLSKEKNQEQILKTEQIIEEICSVKTAFYAPPYGEYNETVLKAAAELNYPTILWSIDTVDWKRPPPELIKNRVIKKLHNGAIVLMHPTEPTAKALREMIREIKSQGYEIKRLSEILEGEK